MSQNLFELTNLVFERLGDAAIEFYHDQMGTASLKRQSARKALDTLVASHEKGETNPFAGDPDAVNFLYGSLSLMLEKQMALAYMGDTQNLKVCNTIIQDLVDLGMVLGFTITIFDENADKEPESTQMQDQYMTTFLRHFEDGHNPELDIDGSIWSLKKARSRLESFISTAGSAEKLVNMMNVPGDTPNELLTNLLDLVRNCRAHAEAESNPQVKSYWNLKAEIVSIVREYFRDQIYP
ncbi:MAG: hypothetical protein VX730_07845 [Pseudomonadota bacterium]|nr:hypothetical protein [Pseudomonadota bacterium]